MRTKQFLAAALLALGACTAADDGGGLNMGVAVQGLTQSEHFCFTWKLFEAVGDGWALADEQAAPVCAANGVDFRSDFATCTHGRRFLVEYNVTFYNGVTVAGTAVAASGGGEGDVCVKNTDKPTTAHLQFANEGNKGGVNPGIEVDQVCWNDKLVEENGQIVSAVWVQPDSCSGVVPDDFCSFGEEMGAGLNTVRTGLTSDGLTRYIFSTSDVDDGFLAYYMAFEPGLAADTLYLYHAPWILSHYYNPTIASRYVIPTLAAFRYNNSVGAIMDSIEFLHLTWDLTASCNGPVDLDAYGAHGEQAVYKPTCTGGALATFAGVLPAGGSTFQIAWNCGGLSEFTSCDAAGIDDGAGNISICEP